MTLDPLRIVFAGTPAFALPSLEAARAAGDVVAVYTQPDRPSGRGRRAQASAVKRAAADAGIAVFQPETLRSTDAQAALAALRPDLMVVVAYGLILPPAVLAIPTLGCVNVHASLLPRWRGAAPIQRAIQAGDRETGVTLMQMAAGLDSGDILLARRCPIESDETAGSLHDRLAALGAGALAELLARLSAGETVAATPQGDDATYAQKIDKAEARIDWSQPAEAIERQVRAFNPVPVASAVLDGERVRIWSARAEAGAGGKGHPGEIASAGACGIDVVTGAGLLRITELQWPGRRAQSAGDAANGRVLEGRRFD